MSIDAPSQRGQQPLRPALTYVSSHQSYQTLDFPSGRKDCYESALNDQIAGTSRLSLTSLRHDLAGGSKQAVRTDWMIATLIQRVIVMVLHYR